MDKLLNDPSFKGRYHKLRVARNRIELDEFSTVKPDGHDHAVIVYTNPGVVDVEDIYMDFNHGGRDAVNISSDLSMFAENAEQQVFVRLQYTEEYAESTEASLANRPVSMSVEQVKIMLIEGALGILQAMSLRGVAPSPDLCGEDLLHLIKLKKVVDDVGGYWDARVANSPRFQLLKTPYMALFDARAMEQCDNVPASKARAILMELFAGSSALVESDCWSQDMVDSITEAQTDDLEVLASTLFLRPATMYSKPIQDSLSKTSEPGDMYEELREAIPILEIEGGEVIRVDNEEVEHQAVLHLGDGDVKVSVKVHDAEPRYFGGVSHPHVRQVHAVYRGISERKVARVVDHAEQTLEEYLQQQENPQARLSALSQAREAALHLMLVHGMWHQPCTARFVVQLTGLDPEEWYLPHQAIEVLNHGARVMADFHDGATQMSPAEWSDAFAKDVRRTIGEIIELSPQFRDESPALQATEQEGAYMAAGDSRVKFMGTVADEMQLIAAQVSEKYQQWEESRPQRFNPIQRPLGSFAKYKVGLSDVMRAKVVSSSVIEVAGKLVSLRAWDRRDSSALLSTYAVMRTKLVDAPPVRRQVFFRMCYGSRNVDGIEFGGVALGPSALVFLEYADTALDSHISSFDDPDYTMASAVALYRSAFAQAVCGLVSLALESRHVLSGQLSDFSVRKVPRDTKWECNPVANSWTVKRSKLTVKIASDGFLVLADLSRLPRYEALVDADESVAPQVLQAIRKLAVEMEGAMLGVLFSGQSQDFMQIMHTDIMAMSRSFGQILEHAMSPESVARNERTVLTETLRMLFVSGRVREIGALIRSDSLEKPTLRNVLGKLLAEKEYVPEDSPRGERYVALSKAIRGRKVSLSVSPDSPLAQEACQYETLPGFFTDQDQDMSWALDVVLDPNVYVTDGCALSETAFMWEQFGSSGRSIFDPPSGREFMLLKPGDVASEVNRKLSELAHSMNPSCPMVRLYYGCWAMRAVGMLVHFMESAQCSMDVLQPIFQRVDHTAFVRSLAIQMILGAWTLASVTGHILSCPYLLVKHPASSCVHTICDYRTLQKAASFTIPVFEYLIVPDTSRVFPVNTSRNTQACAIVRNVLRALYCKITDVDPGWFSEWLDHLETLPSDDADLESMSDLLSRMFPDFLTVQ